MRKFLVNSSPTCNESSWDSKYHMLYIWPFATCLGCTRTSRSRHGIPMAASTSANVTSTTTELAILIRWYGTSYAKINHWHNSYRISFVANYSNLPKPMASIAATLTTGKSLTTAKNFVSEHLDLGRAAYIENRNKGQYDVTQ